MSEQQAETIRRLQTDVQFKDALINELRYSLAHVNVKALEARCATLTAAIEKAIADTRSDAQLSKNPIRAELLNVAHRFADALAAAPQGGKP